MVEVELRPLDDAAIGQAVSAAVAGADPVEVMPPVDGPPGWTPERCAAYADFLAARRDVETCWLVLADGVAAGVARLRGREDGDGEVGVWLVRSLRGRGVGGLLLRQLADHARRSGARRLVADTTRANGRAVRVLERAGARMFRHPDGSVLASLSLGAGTHGPRLPG